MDKMIKEEIKVDAIITDIPYGTTNCRWDSIIPFGKMWERLIQLTNDNSPIVLFGGQPFTSALIMSNPKMFKTTWVWDKCRAGNFVQSKRHPLKVTEDIVVFGKKQIKYNPQKTERAKEKVLELLAKDKKKDTTRLQKEGDNYFNMKSGVFKPTTDFKMAYPINIIKINSSKKECNSKHRLHPTQKPVELMEYLINTYSDENDLILDFTCGSGSTLCACINTNRKYIGIEKDKLCYKIAYDRISGYINI